MSKSRVLVCGTSYGYAYALALSLAPERYAVCGLLSRGSAASQALAGHLGVPLYRAVSEVPDGIDLACVVVGTTPGARIAAQLLERGVPTIMEGPLKGDDVRACLAAAEAGRTRFHLNVQKAHLDAPRTFLAAVRRQPAFRPYYLLVETTRRSMHFLVDLVFRAFPGVVPFRIDGVASPVGGDDAVAALGRYATVSATLGEVPTTWLVHAVVGAVRDGREDITSNRVTVGFANGELTLAELSGPVLWSRRRAGADADPVWSRLDAPAATREDYLLRQGADANLLAVDQLLEHVRTGREPAGQSPEHLRACSDFNDALRAGIGPAPKLDWDQAPAVSAFAEADAAVSTA